MRITMRGIINKIANRLTQWRLRPIRVFCFHQTSEQFDADVYCKPDWVALSSFQEKITALLEEGYTFISLEEAYRHITNDKVRFKKYAVLTADDGLKCQLALLPWLEQHNIPLTLFVNIITLDGETCGEPIKLYFDISCKKQEVKYAEALYLTKQDLWNANSPMLTVGLHGYSHEDVSCMDAKTFSEQLDKSQKIISRHPNYVPFYAYTFGRHNDITDEIILQKNMTPVLLEGRSNLADNSRIYREIL